MKGVGEGLGQSHVKSGGLALGEFVDDRLQNHSHSLYIRGSAGFDESPNVCGGNSNSGVIFDTGYIAPVFRFGTTTEVKAVGMNFIIKY